MTNPPFYKSAEEMAEKAAEKCLPPLTACTGAPVEMVTEGGEVAFVGRILDQSLELRGRIQWYTAMFGFMSSVSALVQRLRENNVDNFAITEFVQGKTKRWAIAWSFQPMRPPQAIARGTTAGSLKASLPTITEMAVIEFPVFTAISQFCGRLQESISSLDAVDWSWDKQKLEGVLKTGNKVWTRAWRRQKQRTMDTTTDEQAKSEKHGMAFGVYVNVNLGSVVVRCRWIEGHDESAFTSFTGYLKTTAKAAHAELDEAKEGTKS